MRVYIKNERKNINTRIPFSSIFYNFITTKHTHTFGEQRKQDTQTTTTSCLTRKSITTMATTSKLLCFLLQSREGCQTDRKILDEIVYSHTILWHTLHITIAYFQDDRIGVAYICLSVYVFVCVCLYLLHVLKYSFCKVCNSILVICIRIMECVCLFFERKVNTTSMKLSLLKEAN